MSKPTLRDWVTGNAYPKLIEKSSEAQEAIQFAQKFQPNKDYNYDWIVDSALKESEFVRDSIRSMDAKADSLIGYIGAGAGVLGLATAYLANEGRAGFILVSGPTLIFFLAAIGIALFVRAPAHLPGFPSARDAFKFANKENGKAIFAAEVMMRSRAARIVIDKKGELPRRSYQLFLIGIAWFALGSVVSAFLRAVLR